MGQEPLFNLLEKFNGEKPFETIAKGGESREIRRYSLRRIPPYIIFIVKRFRNNNFFIEKNPTIVTFPLKGLDLRDYVHPDCQPAIQRQSMIWLRTFAMMVSQRRAPTRCRLSITQRRSGLRFMT